MSDVRAAEEIFAQRLDESRRQVDRVFALLMLAQWVFAILLALVWSPWAWEGRVRSVHVHLWAAALLGGLLCSLPLLLIRLRPGAAATRHVVAVSQMLWSALLIHLSGGRIETHFHVFGSLAFLAFYRDWGVLVTGTLVVVADHLLRGLLWPESVYGTGSPEWWRFLEHAFWVVFEDVVLVLGCLRGVRELREAAAQQASNEALSEHELLKKSRALELALGELERSKETAVRAERLAAVGQLAASVAHELRNPLAAIRSAGAYLQKKADGADPRVPQFLTLIDREVAVCTKIATDLLDFARERAPQLAPCPVHAVVTEALGVITRPEGSRAVLLNQVPEALPMPLADRDQLRQVVVNLVQNGVEALPGGEGTVTVRASTGAETWRLSVEDTGAGISPGAQARVFEPLFTTKTKGTGLGLAIVAAIARRHHGHVTLASEPGRGTTVTVELPMAPQGIDPPAAASASPAEVWVN